MAQHSTDKVEQDNTGRVSCSKWEYILTHLQFREKIERRQDASRRREATRVHHFSLALLVDEVDAIDCRAVLSQRGKRACRERDRMRDRDRDRCG